MSTKADALAVTFLHTVYSIIPPESETYFAHMGMEPMSGWTVEEKGAAFSRAQENNWIEHREGYGEVYFLTENGRAVIGV
ncbi:hypothetical protein [Burkholderia cepacia]|uniref:hypothetical protein n=1 Tax=Burkholderia cepacia TaxID=292 RepID=UPI002AB40DEC|nr:hypothetical protein [Burkholderia cepacia]HEM8509875.1 hypothetical protein [Burkholderia cepacia]